MKGTHGMKDKKLILATILILSLCWGIASAEDISQIPMEYMKFDLSVPESPAFTVLGLIPESVVHPTSPRTLAISFLNGTDPNGNLQSGLALDTAPYLLFFGREITLEKYRTSPWERLASRTQLSFATAKGSTDDDKAARLGIGLRFTLWDRGDPRLDRSEDGLIKCYLRESKDPHKEVGKKLNQSRIAREVIPKIEGNIAELSEKAQLTPEEAKKLAELRGTLKQRKQEVIENEEEFKEEEIAKLKDENDKIRDVCSEKAAKKHWNASSWSLGIAPTWTSPDGSTDDLEWSGAGIYTSLAYGFEEFVGLENAAQFILHLRYRSEEKAPDPDIQGTFFEQDAFIVGAQLRLKGPSFGNKIGGRDLSFSLEADYIDADRKGREDDTLFRYSLGADLELSDNLYLKLTFGTETGREDDSDQGFVIGNLKLGFN